MNTVLLPTENYYGEGSIEQLATLRGRCSKAFIVTDRNLVNMGLLDHVIDILKRKGISYAVFDGVKSNPTRSIVDDGVRKLKEEGPGINWIIGFGGGSAIDTAKAMRLFYIDPAMNWERIFGFAGLPVTGLSCKLAAISTTSGTGSEVSFAAGITDDHVHPFNAQSILGRAMVPDMSITDPLFPSHMPPELTAASGFDALGHALEAYIGQGGNEFSRSIALLAFKMIYLNLEKSYREGDDFKAREGVHIGQMYAAVAFNIAGLGIAHSLGHPLIGYYEGISHGLACGLMLPYAMRFNKPVVAGKFFTIAQAIGLNVKSERDAADKLMEALVELASALDFPLSLRAAGIKEEQFKEDLDYLVNKAFNDDLTGLAVRKPTCDQLRELYIDAYQGNI